MAELRNGKPGPEFLVPSQADEAVPDVDHSSAGPTSMWQRAIRVGGAIVSLIVGLTVLGSFVEQTRSCGRSGGGPVGHAVRATVSVTALAAEPSNWTPELREQYVAPLRVAVRGSPGVVTEADVDENIECFWKRFTAAVPGGPRELAQIGQARAKEIAASAGRECALQKGQRISSSRVWSPQFASFFVAGCTLTQGQDMRTICECLAAKAPKYFGSPPAFMRAWKSTDDAPAEQAMQRLTAACNASSN